MVNRLVSILTAFALVLTALVPSGFMAARAADGSFTIELCGTAGNETLLITPDDPKYELYRLLHGEENEETERSEGNSACHAGMSPVGALPDGDIEPTGMAGRAMIEGNRTSVLTGIFPSGLPPATGPPAS